MGITELLLTAQAEGVLSDLLDKAQSLIQEHTGAASLGGIAVGACLFAAFYEWMNDNSDDKDEK